jgi:peptidyl-prolyl cis-trans isomerase C
MTALLRARAASAPPPSISVNGTVIPRAAITREVQYHPASSPSASWRKAAQALVLRELLLQEARRGSLVATPLVDERGRRETVEEAQIRALVEREVRVPAPTEDELRRYYEANQAKFRSPEIVEARHILVAARASDVVAFVAARAKAAALAEELAANPRAFDDLARANSDCASSGEGGRLGQLIPDETTPEFAAAVADLAEGETTLAPIETRYGFHIIRLDRRIAGNSLPFECAAPRIAEYLRERAQHTATAQYLARLVSHAEITGIEIAGAEAFRVN